MISKKMFAWFVVTYFFYIQRIPAEAYLYFTAAIFVIDVAQKIQGGGISAILNASGQVPSSYDSQVVSTSTVSSRVNTSDSPPDTPKGIPSDIGT
jgi:hypothetical protein